MGYGITAYRANMQRVATRFGIKVSKKKSPVRKACRPRAAAIDELYDDEPPLFLDIVEELLDGKAEHEDQGARYWYAYEGFVQALGQRLANNEFYPGDAEPFVSHSAFRIYDIDAPMDIPHPDDFPMVLTLRKDAMTDDVVAEVVAEMSAEQGRQFSFWIKEARQYKQDLVLFYY